MAQQQDEPIGQLATRIPTALHRKLRVHCVVRGITLQAFVTAALESKLRKDAARA